MTGDIPPIQRSASLPLLAAAFVIAFGVLILVPVWAELGVLASSGHDSHHGGPATDDAAFAAQAEAQMAAYGQPDGSVKIPAGETVYILAQQFSFNPAVIHLERGAEYTLAFHATDVMHGVSLIMGGSLASVLMPGTTVVVPLRATESGDVQMLCTEYCGLGHNQMVGRIVVDG